jgi:hypothetical protein
MSGIVNLHRILGQKFEHAHPECPLCTHRRYARADEVGAGFVDYCEAKARVLCCGKPRRCRSFAALARAEGPRDVKEGE